MGGYRECALEAASGVELIVALYDGMIRFLRQASDAVDRQDVSARRIAVKRAFDIIIHLQARLRMDIGGRPAQALGEFYVSTFAQILQASQAASRPKFEHAIECVRNMRDAWKQVARDVSPEGIARAGTATPELTGLVAGDGGAVSEDGEESVRWLA